MTAEASATLTDELRASESVGLPGPGPAVLFGGQALPTHSLLWRVFSTNALVLAAAVVILALSPLTVSWPVNIGEAFVLLTGLAGMLLVNLVLMRRALTPLGRLWEAMRLVDPLRPGQRVDPGARSIEVAELAAAFNDMLDRLELERRDSARRAQSAQEAERRWLSLELHDEIGQGMTALLLRLEVLSRGATDAQAALVADATAATRDCLQRVRAIVTRLRPEALDDLGLESALVQLCDRMSEAQELTIEWTVDRDLPQLTQDAQLVVYRVAQESLTNVTRHAAAAEAHLQLCRHGRGIRLTVRDDGRGFAQQRSPGSGIRGMRERALTIGSDLRIDSGRSGTTVVLDVRGDEVLG